MNNDRLKLRAWDGRKMTEEFHVDSQGKVIARIGYFSNDITPLILVQCTGLKDRNDKLIYEKHIVRCANGHIGVIEWEENDCCFNVTDYYNVSNDYPTMAFHEGQPFEIIGDIYQNKELLNDS